MDAVTDLDDKLRLVRAAFAPLVGARLSAVETAELHLDDGTWSPWRDLPIRLYTDTGAVVSVSWSKFDDLWIAPGTPLPFSIEGSEVRWVRDAEPVPASFVGGRIGAVWLGRDAMSFGGPTVPIWTRLFVQVGSGWLEIYNALDENGYERHDVLPEAERVCGVDAEGGRA